MPTQRPFLSNFLAAFRAHSQTLPKPSPSISSTATATSTASIWSAAQPPKSTQSSQPVEPAATSPRPITQKSTTYSTTTTTTTTAAAQDRQLQVSLSPLQHTVSPQTHLPRSPSSPGLPVYGPPNKPTQDFPTSSWSSSSSRRRGSDSSDGSGGFREVRTGGEKWFVGGRTAGGEERYYQLRMVKRDRDRSIGAVSADQLSL